MGSLDRLTLKIQEDQQEVWKARPYSGLKFRVVQLIVMVVAVLSADTLMNKGQFRRTIGFEYEARRFGLPW